VSLLETDLPPEAFAAALAALPGIGPAGLADLLCRHDPETAWGMVLRGDERRPDRTTTSKATTSTDWATAARRFDLSRQWRHIQAHRIGVAYIGQPHFPAALEEDPQPAGVVFWLGDLSAVDGRCVAIVGTRRSSGYGRRVAFEFARDLAHAGVCVVSGLALGIDGAAHDGALAAAAPTAGASGTGSTAGIAASGVDRPYPRRHTQLWNRVVAAGVVISETNPGHPAQAWRFPARNRIIAALSQAVVVVESGDGGGSMLTVDSAIKRGLPVLAVPGPVTSSSSAGTNKLIYEGAIPARNVGDVLAAIGDLRPWPPRESGETRPSAIAELDAPAQHVLAVIDWTPTSTATIAERSGLPLGELSAILVRLEELSVIAGDGSWWERRDRTEAS
jgi:DNA processing protein